MAMPAHIHQRIIQELAAKPWMTYRQIAAELGSRGGLKAQRLNRAAKAKAAARELAAAVRPAAPEVKLKAAVQPELPGLFDKLSAVSAAYARISRRLNI